MNCLSGRRRGEPLLLATFTASPSLPPFFLVHDLAFPSEQHRRRRKRKKKGGGGTEISNHKLEETGKEGEGENGARPSSSIADTPGCCQAKKTPSDPLQKRGWVDGLHGAGTFSTKNKETCERILVLLRRQCHFIHSEFSPSPVPSLFAGFLLKSALSSDCASGLRYSGIPSLARRIWFIVSLRFSPCSGEETRAIVERQFHRKLLHVVPHLEGQLACEHLVLWKRKERNRFGALA